MLAVDVRLVHSGSGRRMRSILSNHGRHGKHGKNGRNQTNGL